MAAPTSPLEVDDVISATGFVAPLLDLPDLGRHDVRAEPAAGPDAVLGEHDACPASTSRGTIGQGAKGLQKHGVPANSGAVHGARYNARVLAAADRTRRTSGSSRSGRTSRPRRSTAFIATELAEAPELFHQRGYLARVLTADPERRVSRRGRHAADGVPRRGRAGRARGDARGRWIGRDLPGRVLAHPGRSASTPSRPIRSWAIEHADGLRIIADLVKRVAHADRATADSSSP